MYKIIKKYASTIERAIQLVSVERLKQRDIKEECYDYKLTLEQGYDYIGAIEKALGLKPIEQTNETIRFYHLPSFDLEKVYEIDLNETGKLLRYQSTQGRIWTDLWDSEIDEKGSIFGGGLKTTAAYSPSVDAQIDSVINKAIYKYILKLSNLFSAHREFRF